MFTKTANYIISATVLLLFLSAACLAAELTGTVKSISGKPLAGVSVVSHATYSYAETDSNGHFNLPKHGRVIYFLAKGFRPVIKLIELETSQIEVMLDESLADEWAVPSCPNTKEMKKRFGLGISFLKPKGAHLKKANDIDYEDYYITYDKQKTEWLEVMFGGMVGGNYPPDEWITASSEFTVRPWRFEKAEGLEIRGHSAEGKYWRWVGFNLTFAAYHGVSKATTEIFDKIIDDMCWKPL